MTTPCESSSASLNRREFTRILSCAVGVTSLGSQVLFSDNSLPSDKAELRAAIIGHTGQGDYGHGLDLVFNEYPHIQVVGVADPDPRGREAAARRSKALRQYADYREMLEKEKPHLVSVAPRATLEHYGMARAAFKVGAHVYMEKPFTQTLAEADELLATAEKENLKIAVAHQMRLAPSILRLKQYIEDGAIGDLAQIRACGKQDHRSGGEDLLVLGTHLFDLMRYFAGEPLWCSARVTQHGRDITPADAHPATEKIGPIAGDEIEAQFSFSTGVYATFTSRATLRQTAGHWGLELIGSKARVRILADIFPVIYVMTPGNWNDSNGTDEWRRIENDPALNATPNDRGVGPANKRITDNWLEAVEKNHEPICSGRAAMKALEMVMAVYRAALSGSRVPLPLADRKHPLKAGQ
jgi:predicted dehydrogenase